MLASISMLNPAHRADAIDVVRFAMPRTGTTVVFHPRYQSWLRRVGLDSAPAILDYPAEIVGGHPDRHVAKLTVDRGRTLFLKREHVVGWSARFKNWRAGFGGISRSEREAITLQWLADAGLPAPQWLAYGTTDDGRAFVLIEELAGARDLLRTPLTNDVASRVGAAVAELHEAGIGTPDLGAKHVFVDRNTSSVTLIDWPSAPLPGPVAWVDRVEAWAKLAASLPDLSARHAIAALKSYWRSCRCDRPPFRLFRDAVTDRARSQTRRRAAALSGDSIRLVWRDGERLVTVPGVDWPRAWETAAAVQKSEWASFDPVGRALAWLRGKPWRSPAAIVARLLVQLQSARVSSPQLVAYGQSLKPFGGASSFVLTDAAAISQPLNRSDIPAAARLVRVAHNAGVRLGRADLDPIRKRPDGSLALNAPAAWRRDQRSRVARDLAVVLSHIEGPTSRTDRLRFVREYQSHGCAMPLSRREIAAIVFGGSR